MKKEVALPIILLIIVFLFTLVSASVAVGNSSHSLNSTVYAQGENIRGWVNLTVSGNSAEELFADNFGNQISLGELLNLNNKDNYCSVRDCQTNYETVSSSEEMTFSLNAGQEKLIGFRLEGLISNVASLDFILNSSAPKFCENQIKLDFLNDGIIEMGNTKLLDEYCSGKDYGCFDPGKSIVEFGFGDSTNRLCQKINLSEAPGFELGVELERTASSENLVMALYSIFGESEIPGASCDLSNTPLSGEVSCSIDYLVTSPGEYYVCVYPEDRDSSTRVKGHNADSGEGCAQTISDGGMSGLGSNDFAFKIFTRPKKFDSVGEIIISNDVTSETLGTKINNYIRTKLSSQGNCTEGCIVPLKIISSVPQEIKLSNLDLTYNLYDSPSRFEESFHEISSTPSEANFPYKIIYLNDANFSVSASSIGNNQFTLSFEGEELFSENISVVEKTTIQDVLPRRTYNSYPLTFEAFIQTNNKTITNYLWDFGDGKNLSTTTNKAPHTYNSTGIYTLKLTVEDSDGLEISRSFSIEVVSAQEILEIEINSTQARIGNLQNQTKDYSGFDKTELERILNLTEKEQKLSQIQQSYLQANSEQRYAELVTELLSLDVPESLVLSESESRIIFVALEGDVDVDFLKGLSSGNGSYTDSAIKTAVAGYGIADISSRLSFNKFLSKERESVEDLIRIYKLEIQRTNSSGKLFVMFSNLQGINFQQGSSVLESSGKKYIEIPSGESSKTIYFSTTQSLQNSRQPPIFISPVLENLDVQKDITPGAYERNFSWKLLLISLLVLLLLALAVYIFLQEWYKRRYENFLFKGRNNMFNLINYISRSKSNNKKDSEIISSLNKSGWNTEQINYALNKYQGKRTGMIEIPVGKVISLFKKIKIPSKKPTENKIPPQNRMGPPGNIGRNNFPKRFPPRRFGPPGNKRSK